MKVETDATPYFPESICEATIKFVGSIKATDLDVIKRIIDATCNEVKANSNGKIKYTLQLDSDGGDVDAALAIGRFIRNVELPVKNVHFEVMVTGSASCYSSCVFILAAGADRTVWGKVGIHRPYFVQLDSKYSAEEIRRIRLAQNKSIKEYLAEMDVAESLLDAMLAIPAEQIKLLTPNELAQYRLVGPDANYEEKRTSEYARAWFLSSAEYRKRKAIVTAKCDALGYATEKYTKCEWKIMLNISDAEYEIRRDRIPAECNSTKNDDAANEDCVYRIRAGK